LSVADLKIQARRKLPRAVFDFIEGGAQDELTVAANRQAFGEIVLLPRWLVDVAECDQGVDVFGTHVDSPVLLAPAGLARMASRGGELDVADAVAAKSSIYVLSMMASSSIEEVSRHAPGRVWFQLYPLRERRITEALVARAAEAGCGALVVTIDLPVLGRKERDLRNGFTMPPTVRPSGVLDAARHARWVSDVLRGSRITFTNFAEDGPGRRLVELGRYINDELSNPSATYADLAWLRERWKGPLVVKGVLTGEDATRAIECGADGIIVSNHGGRQLDGAPASLSVLPEVVAAVAGRALVFLDGGVRRGGDVVKAVALGARACLIGRPYWYGLAAGGEAGVRRVLEILAAEIDNTLALTGRRSLAELGPDLVAPASAWLGALTGREPGDTTAFAHEASRGSIHPLSGGHGRTRRAWGGLGADGALAAR
jgi:L-lactate dehydrogenase (cytochrome)